MAKKRDELTTIRDKLELQFAATELASDTLEEDISSLAKRTLQIKGRITDEQGFLKDREEEPYVELMEFLGAGGQYLVFKGRIHWDRVTDFAKMWIPLEAHQLMESEGVDISKFHHYGKVLGAQARKAGSRKTRRKVRDFLSRSKLFPRNLCAVKVSIDNITKNPRAKRETFTIGMYHPNIVFTLTEGRTAGNRVYRVMELVPRFIAPPQIRRELGLDEQIQVTLKVAEVLSYIEQKGAIHRDLKPDNIMLVPTHNGVRPKVGDFGLMKLREFQEVISFLTASSCMFLGTPEYVAPEQAQDPAKADIRSDLYCLGATAYYWWTGQSPNPVRDNVSPRERVHLKFINAINREQKPKPPLHLKGVRRDFFSTKANKYQAVLAGLLVSDPAIRYQNPLDVVEDLRRIQEGKPVSGPPAPLQQVKRHAYSPGRDRVSRGRRAIGVWLLGLVILGCIYIALNESPALRDALPAWVVQHVPWYR
jgi:serine/threonine protein kinase